MDQPEIISRKEAIARGLKRYFTGKPCKRGHMAERLISTKACAECMRIFDLERRTKEPDRGSKYYAKNAEVMRAKWRRWAAKNPDANRANSTKNRAELSRAYIACKLNIPTAQLTEELYAMKREQIELHRLQIELNRQIKRLTK
ncbi:MAG: hypothetical protein AAFO57_00340 [Pseudomonadota bacterium]